MGDLTMLRSIPNLYADPYRPPLPPPFFSAALKQRAELIAEHAVFQEDDDAVPLAGTVATVFAINSNGVATKSDANLVGENYWGISGVLSR